MWVEVSGVARFFFSLLELTSNEDSFTVSIQPLRAIAWINICAHIKNPKHWQPYPCLDTQKYCTHIQVKRPVLHLDFQFTVLPSEPHLAPVPFIPVQSVVFVVPCTHDRNSFGCVIRNEGVVVRTPLCTGKVCMLRDRGNGYCIVQIILLRLPDKVTKLLLAKGCLVLEEHVWHSRTPSKLVCLDAIPDNEPVTDTQLFLIIGEVLK